MSADLAAVVFIQVLYGIANLVIVSAGLAVIFGMMKVINLAHGEFLMLGGYATLGAIKLGVNLWIAMLIVAPLAVGLVGVVLERLVIRHLYGRMVDTMLATWGLSLLLVGIMTTLVGNTTAGDFDTARQLFDRQLFGQQLHARDHRNGGRCWRSVFAGC